MEYWYLWVGGVFQGAFSSLNAVYDKLDSFFLQVDYADDLHFEVDGPDVSYSITMAGGHWEALCEDRWSFRTWLDIRGGDQGYNFRV